MAYMKSGMGREEACIRVSQDRIDAVLRAEDDAKAVNAMPPLTMTSSSNENIIDHAHNHDHNRGGNDDTVMKEARKKQEADELDRKFAERVKMVDLQVAAAKKAAVAAATDPSIASSATTATSSNWTSNDGTPVVENGNNESPIAAPASGLSSSSSMSPTSTNNATTAANVTPMSQFVTWSMPSATNPSVSNMNAAGYFWPSIPMGMYPIPCPLPSIPTTASGNAISGLPLPLPFPLPPLPLQYPVWSSHQASSRFIPPPPSPQSVTTPTSSQATTSTATRPSATVSTMPLAFQYPIVSPYHSHPLYNFNPSDVNYHNYYNGSRYTPNYNPYSSSSIAPPMANMPFNNSRMTANRSTSSNCGAPRRNGIGSGHNGRRPTSFAATPPVSCITHGRGNTSITPPLIPSTTRTNSDSTSTTSRMNTSLVASLPLVPPPVLIPSRTITVPSSASAAVAAVTTQGRVTTLSPIEFPPLPSGRESSSATKSPPSDTVLVSTVVQTQSIRSHDGNGRGEGGGARRSVGLRVGVAPQMVATAMISASTYPPTRETPVPLPTHVASAPTTPSMNHTLSGNMLITISRESGMIGTLSVGGMVDAADGGGGADAVATMSTSVRGVVDGVGVVARDRLAQVPNPIPPSMIGRDTRTVVALPVDNITMVCAAMRSNTTNAATTSPLPSSPISSPPSTGVAAKKGGRGKHKV
jgi:hypothetical protein